MTVANDDGFGGGPITANAAREMAVGFAALAELAERVGDGPLRSAFAGHLDHDLAAAIGKVVLKVLDPPSSASVSGVPISRETEPKSPSLIEGWFDA